MIPHVRRALVVMTLDLPSPEGATPKQVSFLPYDPETPTDYVYWDVE